MQKKARAKSARKRPSVDELAAKFRGFAEHYNEVRRMYLDRVETEARTRIESTSETPLAKGQAREILQLCDAIRRCHDRADPSGCEFEVFRVGVLAGMLQLSVATELAQMALANAVIFRGRPVPVSDIQRRILACFIDRDAMPLAELHDAVWPEPFAAGHQDQKRDKISRHLTPLNLRLADAKTGVQLHVQGEQVVLSGAT